MSKISLLKECIPLFSRIFYSIQKLLAICTYKAWFWKYKSHPSKIFFLFCWNTKLNFMLYSHWVCMSWVSGAGQWSYPKASVNNSNHLFLLLVAIVDFKWIIIYSHTWATNSSAWLVQANNCEWVRELGGECGEPAGHCPPKNRSFQSVSWLMPDRNCLPIPKKSQTSRFLQEAPLPS